MRKKMACLAVAAFLPALAWAQVSITDPWVRATTSQQKATGAFMKLEAKEPMTLVGARAAVANVVEVHEMVTQDGVMKMRAIPGLSLPAGKPVELKPGGYHIMLMDLKAPIAVDQQVAITLILEDARKVRTEQTLEAPARALNASSPEGKAYSQH